MQVLFLGPCPMQEASAWCSGTCHVQDCNFETLSHQISCFFQDVPRGYFDSWLLLLVVLLNWTDKLREILQKRPSKYLRCFVCQLQCKYIWLCCMAGRTAINSLRCL